MSNAKTGTRWTPLSIAALVLAFLVWWPLGLAVLAYILWGGNVDGQVNDMWRKATAKSTGNKAFDEYKEQTLKRLEEEQEAFADFVDKLRQARDREEFERFMADRGKA